MRKETFGKAGLAATILLLPGGFLLGFALLAVEYRKRAAMQRKELGEPDERGATSVGDLPGF